MEIRSETSAAEDKWAFARANATLNHFHGALGKTEGNLAVKHVVSGQVKGGIIVETCFKFLSIIV